MVVRYHFTYLTYNIPMGRDYATSNKQHVHHYPTIPTHRYTFTAAAAEIQSSADYSAPNAYAGTGRMVVKFLKGWTDEVAGLSVTVSHTGTREEGGRMESACVDK